MTNKLWIFPAIFSVLIALTFLEGFSILGFILCVLWFIRILCLKNRSILIFSVLISMLFLGWIHNHQNTNQSAYTGTESTFIIYPKVTSVQVDGNSVRFDGVLQDQGTEEKIVVQYSVESEVEKDQWTEEPPIAQLLVKGELVDVAGPSNFHQFNYRNYLKRNNIHWQLQAESIEKSPFKNESNPKFHLVEKVRFSIFQFIDQVFNEKIASYLKTLFFADNRDFSEEALQQFRSLGVIHLFSISGFHITFLAKLIREFLLSLGVTHERTRLLLLIILPLYGLVAGFRVSVFRAVSQNILLLLSKVLNRPMDTVDAWSMTMIIALFLQPYSIYQISFQLSYTLSGIFILMSKQKWIQDLNGLSYSFLFSLMSGLASLPILSYHFFEIPWITIFSNLLFIPFFTYVLFPALLVLFLLSFVLSRTLFFVFLNEVLTLLLTTVEQFLTLLNRTFDFSFVTGRLPMFILFLLTVSVFIFLRNIERKKQPPILVVLTLLFSLFYYQISPMGYVLMLDVGQGESLVIKEPMSSKITLIDTGGQFRWGEEAEWEKRTPPFSIGKDRVVPALKSLGISTIDRLYLTHADVDHMGEMAAIGTEIKIKEVAASQFTLSDSEVLDQLRELAPIDFKIIQPPEKVTFPNEEALALYPLGLNQSKNNQSLVLYVRMGEDRWLLTGDIEKEAEQQLVQEYPNLKANVLKVAHHGSLTSSTATFIEHIQPEVALISVGKNNTYGHPNQEVLGRFEAEGIDIYSTSEHGAIMKRYLKIPFIDYWFSDLQTVHKN